MKRRLMFAALAALLVPASMPALVRGDAALAPTAADATGFTVASDPASSTEVPDNEGALLASAYQPSTQFQSSRYQPRYEASRYRPRRERPRDRYREPPRYSRVRGVTQVHAGFLDPDGEADAGFLAGFRGGQQFDDMFQIGLGVDWRNKSGRLTEVIQETVGPGGETIIVQRELSSYSSNLFPGLAYIQISGPSDLGLVPYVGFAGSWQVLFLSANDFSTGESFDATYDGFGWQLWGGAALPIGARSKFVGEVFLNNADLTRDVFDPSTGSDIRETVSTDGVGARFGLNWGF